MFLPTNISDISTVVAYASHEHLDIAICGGAHSTAGCSSTDGGLLISLSKMRKATCDPEAQTITAQGGCLWEDVDEASQPHGLATVGGTVHHTGIGGLTLGGGFGWLSYKYGLVVDNLLSMTIVVASGEVLVATPTQNADLFWALCGAGQNFGVVVEFVYQAYPQTDVWAGLLIYTPDKLPQVVEAWNKLEPSMTERDLSGAIVFARPPPAGGKPVVMSVVFHNSNDEAKAKDAFRPLLDVGPIMDTTSLVPYKAVNSMISPPINGCRSSTKGLSFTFPLRPAFVAEQFDAFVAFSDSENEIPGTELSISLWEVVPPAQVAKRDNAATAFSNRGNHFNALVQPMWQRAEDDAVCRQWARDRRVDFQKELERSLGAKEQERERNQAVMFYGNYDRKWILFSGMHLTLSPPPCFLIYCARSCPLDLPLISPFRPEGRGH